MIVQTPCSPVDRALLREEIDGVVNQCLDQCAVARLDLSVVNTALRNARHGIMSRLVQASTNEAMSQPLALRCPACRQFLAYHDVQEKVVTMPEGSAALRRGRYRCSACGKEYIPADEGNDLEETGYTLDAQAEIVGEAVGDTYRETSEDVKPEIQVSHQTVGRMVGKAAGWRMGEEDGAVKATLGDMDKPGAMPSGEAVPLASTWQEKDLRAEPEGKKEDAHGCSGMAECSVGQASAEPPTGSAREPEPVCVVSVDGGLFPTTEKDEAGKVAWKEARTATFMVAQDGEQLPRQKAGGKLYLARCLAAAKMLPLMAAAYLLLPEWVRALPLVFIADGGPWWGLVPMYFPNAVQILDLRHAAETLEAAAGRAFGGNSDRAKEWKAHIWEWLQEEGHLEKLLAELEGALPLIADDKERHEVELAIGYARTHEKRMRYWVFAEMGYPIGSGVVESAVDQVIQERLRGAGMRWRYEQADNMVCLRAAALSGELAGIFQRRKEACGRRLDAYFEPQQHAA